jgi:Fe-Mn family superoxide dismutase
MSKLQLPKIPIILGALPFDYDALEPILTARNVVLHYDGHHAGYVKKYNSLLKKGGSKDDLEFNYSGYILHIYYWNNLAPPYSTIPGPLFTKKADNVNQFIQKIINKALQIKGSGWTIVVQDRFGRLDIKNIPNHKLVDVLSYKPILIVDVWEHAYYPSYENRKKDFFQDFFKIVDWDRVETRLR